MFTKTYPLILALAFLTACHDPLPCPDCTDDDVAEDSEPLPDLPCDGADLMSDNDNCGSCGNECQINYEGTQWEDGTCVEGKCGPHWTICNNFSGNENCAEICAGFDRSCVAQGCSGKTGMLYYVGFDGNCRAHLGPDIEMTGSCDEPIPWEMTVEHNVYAMCCCE